MMKNTKAAPIQMTYELAMRLGKEAADRQMRSAGRSKWNRSDYNLMVRTFNHYWPESR